MRKRKFKSDEHKLPPPSPGGVFGRDEVDTKIAPHPQLLGALFRHFFSRRLKKTIWSRFRIFIIHLLKKWHCKLVQKIAINQKYTTHLPAHFFTMPTGSLYALCASLFWIYCHQTKAYNNLAIATLINNLSSLFTLLTWIRHYGEIIEFKNNKKYSHLFHFGELNNPQSRGT